MFCVFISTYLFVIYLFMRVSPFSGYGWCQCWRGGYGSHNPNVITKCGPRSAVGSNRGRTPVGGCGGPSGRGVFRWYKATSKNVCHDVIFYKLVPQHFSTLVIVRVSFFNPDYERVPIEHFGLAMLRGIYIHII